MSILLLILSSLFTLALFATLVGAAVLGTLMDRRLRGEK